jgi:DNA-binding CsgD family transcriptional regulator
MHTIPAQPALAHPPSGHAAHFDPIAARGHEVFPTRLLLAGLDGLSHGLALLDVRGRPLYTNTAARATFDRDRWIVEGECLCRADPKEQTLWRTAVQESGQRGRHQLFQCRGAGADVFVSLAPLAADDTPMVLATFGRGELCGELDLQLFGSRHGLTYAEHQVLRKLVAGMAAAQIAKQHGVAVSTVLTQVASIRLKAGVSSVRELLALLARLPPLLPLPVVGRRLN